MNNPSEAQKLRREAQQKAAKGDLGGALASYQRLLKLEPDEPRIWVNIADICLKLGQQKEALQIYEKAANQYAAHDDIKQAVSVMQTILNLQPKDERALKQLRILQSRLAIERAAERGGDTIAQFYAERSPSVGVKMGVIEGMVGDRSAIDFEQKNTPQEAAKENLFQFAERARNKPVDVDVLTLTGAIHSDIMQKKVDPQAPTDRIRKGLVRLREFPLFANVPLADLEATVAGIRLHTFEPGEQVMAENSRGESLFVVVSGTVSMSKRETSGNQVGLAILYEGNFFGEGGYLTGQAREISAAAYDDCRVVEVSKASLDTIAGKHPEFRQILEKFYRRRLVEFSVAICPIFRALADNIKGKVIEASDAGTVPVGTLVCEQGKLSSGLFIVITGSIDVSVQTAEGFIKANSLSPGDAFGEASFITGKPMPANYAAAMPTRLLKLKPDRVLELFEQHPEVRAAAKNLTEIREREFHALANN